jgi:NitT/TauT family transport system substrate-binding protein
MMIRVRRAVKVLWSTAIIVVAVAMTAAVPAMGQGVEKKNVSLMLDWTISGTHAPFFIALDKGYYKDEGLNVRIDRGTGAGNTAANVASGVYDFGWADVPTMIGFDAKNPEKLLTLVYISFQDSPLAVLSLKKSGIKKLKDLQGKTVGDMPGSASGAILDVLTKPGTPDEIIKGDVDAIMVFDVSSVMSLIDLGVPRDQINLMMYSDIGFDVYGTGLWVRRDFLKKNPKTVAAMVRAINRGTIDAIKNPQAAAELMKRHNSLLNPKIECQRLLMALHHDLKRDAREKGLSNVEPKLMKSTIDQVVTAMKYKRTPTLDEVWTDKFLPPKSERIPPKLGSCSG